MPKHLIGLCGFAGTGKNTVARYIGWPEASFASRLKAECDPLAIRIGYEPLTEKEAIRDLYVLVGKLAREKDPLFWVRNLILPLSDRVTVTDVRYLNEVQEIWRRGGLVVRLHRAGIGPSNEEEARSFREIHDWCRDEGALIPEVHNVDPAQAAERLSFR